MAATYRRLPQAAREPAQGPWRQGRGSGAQSRGAESEAPPSSCGSSGSSSSSGSSWRRSVSSSEEEEGSQSGAASSEPKGGAGGRRIEARDREGSARLAAGRSATASEGPADEQAAFGGSRTGHAGAALGHAPMPVMDVAPPLPGSRAKGRPGSCHGPEELGLERRAPWHAARLRPKLPGLMGQGAGEGARAQADLASNDQALEAAHTRRAGDMGEVHQQQLHSDAGGAEGMGPGPAPGQLSRKLPPKTPRDEAGKMSVPRALRGRSQSSGAVLSADVRLHALAAPDAERHEEAAQGLDAGMGGRAEACPEGGGGGTSAGDAGQASLEKRLPVIALRHERLHDFDRGSIGSVGSSCSNDSATAHWRSVSLRAASGSAHLDAGRAGCQSLQECAEAARNAVSARQASYSRGKTVVSAQSRHGRSRSTSAVAAERGFLDSPQGLSPQQTGKRYFGRRSSGRFSWDQAMPDVGAEADEESDAGFSRQPTYERFQSLQPQASARLRRNSSCSQGHAGPAEPGLRDAGTASFPRSVSDQMPNKLAEASQPGTGLRSGSLDDPRGVVLPLHGACTPGKRIPSAILEALEAPRLAAHRRSSRMRLRQLQQHSQALLGRHGYGAKDARLSFPTSHSDGSRAWPSGHWNNLDPIVDANAEAHSRDMPIDDRPPLVPYHKDLVCPELSQTAGSDRNTGRLPQQQQLSLGAVVPAVLPCLSEHEAEAGEEDGHGVDQDTAVVVQVPGPGRGSRAECETAQRSKKGTCSAAECEAEQQGTNGKCSQAEGEAEQQGTQGNCGRAEGEAKQRGNEGTCSAAECEIEQRGNEVTGEQEPGESEEALGFFASCPWEAPNGGVNRAGEPLADCLFDMVQQQGLDGAQGQDRGVLIFDVDDDALLESPTESADGMLFVNEREAAHDPQALQSGLMDREGWEPLGSPRGPLAELEGCSAEQDEAVEGSALDLQRNGRHALPCMTQRSESLDTGLWRRLRVTGAGADADTDAVGSLTGQASYGEQSLWRRAKHMNLFRVTSLPCKGEASSLQGLGRVAVWGQGAVARWVPSAGRCIDADEDEEMDEPDVMRNSTSRSDGALGHEAQGSDDEEMGELRRLKTYTCSSSRHRSRPGNGGLYPRPRPEPIIVPEARDTSVKPSTLSSLFCGLQSPPSPPAGDETIDLYPGPHSPNAPSSTATESPVAQSSRQSHAPFVSPSSPAERPKDRGEAVEAELEVQPGHSLPGTDAGPYRATEDAGPPRRGIATLPATPGPIQYTPGPSRFARESKAAESRMKHSRSMSSCAAPAKEPRKSPRSKKKGPGHRKSKSALPESQDLTGHSPGEPQGPRAGPIVSSRVSQQEAQAHATHKSRAVAPPMGGPLCESSASAPELQSQQADAAPQGVEGDRCGSADVMGLLDSAWSSGSQDRHRQPRGAPCERTGALGSLGEALEGARSEAGQGHMEPEFGFPAVASAAPPAPKGEQLERRRRHQQQRLDRMKSLGKVRPEAQPAAQGEQIPSTGDGPWTNEAQACPNAERESKGTARHAGAEGQEEQGGQEAQRGHELQSQLQAQHCQGSLSTKAGGAQLEDAAELGVEPQPGLPQASGPSPEVAAAADADAEEARRKAREASLRAKMRRMRCRSAVDEPSAVPSAAATSAGAFAFPRDDLAAGLTNQDRPWSRRAPNMQPAGTAQASPPMGGSRSFTVGSATKANSEKPVLMPQEPEERQVPAQAGAVGAAGDGPSSADQQGKGKAGTSEDPTLPAVAHDGSARQLGPAAGTSRAVGAEPNAGPGAKMRGAIATESSATRSVDAGAERVGVAGSVVLEAARWSRVEEEYEVDRRLELGHGRFGRIWQCRHRKSRQRAACKSISKASLKKEADVADVQREVSILEQLKGFPHVAQLYDVFEDEQDVHIVMELCEGGDLFERVSRRLYFSEDDAAHVMRTVLQVLEQCHALGIVHRDLKPENILLTHEDSNTSAKVIDFGIAARLPDRRHKLDERLGSPCYMAPEVIGCSYGVQADVWSAGVVLYILLCGRPPFWAQDVGAMFASIQSGHLNFSFAPWPQVSDEAKDLVQRMLTVEPLARISPTQALCHPFITSRCKEEASLVGAS